MDLTQLFCKCYCQSPLAFCLLPPHFLARRSCTDPRVPVRFLRWNFFTTPSLRVSAEISLGWDPFVRTHPAPPFSKFFLPLGLIPPPFSPHPSPPSFQILQPASDFLFKLSFMRTLPPRRALSLLLISSSSLISLFETVLFHPLNDGPAVTKTEVGPRRSIVSLLSPQPFFVVTPCVEVLCSRP